MIGAMLEQFEQIARAIADPSRIRILKLLEAEELCVCQITAVLGLAPATVSKHLSLLRQAGLIAQRKSGRWVYYRLADRSANPYAPVVRDLLAGVLGGDEIIAADRQRLVRVKQVPVERLCAAEGPLPALPGLDPGPAAPDFLPVREPRP
jgi:DNA-binding transcriptional ArsR family regulator